jgi:two-component system, OmpR family, sensor histidine kinase KdpD
MPDSHAGNGHGWLPLAMASLKGALAEARLSNSPFSLVMVGLMGEPPLPGPDNGLRGWIAGTRAALARLFASGRPFRDTIETGLPRLSLGTLDRWPTDHATPRRYFSAVLLVGVAVGICLALRSMLAAGSLVLPFLIVIMLCAIAYGLLPSLLASVLSVLAYDFLFLPPLYSLTVSEPDDVVRLVVFALAGLIVSNLASYARRQAVSASQRAVMAEDLYRFSRQLTGAATLRDVMDSALPQLRAMLRVPVLIAVPDSGDVTIYPEAQNPNAMAAANTAVTGTELAHVKSWLRQNPEAGPDPHASIAADWMLVPMRTGRGKVGVMAIARETLDKHQVPKSDALYGTVADLLAQAIDRINLVEDLNRASRAAEREALHAALLASLSHDLRTPLTSVLGTAESLITYAETPGTETYQALARSIQDEARRLDRYIGNLLDMTRIDTGLTGSTASRIDLEDIVGVALDRCAKSLSGHRLNVAMGSDLPMLAGDEILLEHVLFNLLDNAAKYSPSGTLIQVRASGHSDHVAIEVIDEGTGIRAVDLDRIFDKFYRSEGQGPQPPGIGLGLSICRGYIEAMGGHIDAGNRTDGAGAVFRITLPIPAGEEVPGLGA